MYTAPIQSAQAPTVQDKPPLLWQSLTTYSTRKLGLLGASGVKSAPAPNSSQTLLKPSPLKWARLLGTLTALAFIVLLLLIDTEPILTIIFSLGILFTLLTLTIRNLAPGSLLIDRQTRHLTFTWGWIKRQNLTIPADSITAQLRIYHATENKWKLTNRTVILILQLKNTNAPPLLIASRARPSLIQNAWQNITQLLDPQDCLYQLPTTEMESPKSSTPNWQYFAHFTNWHRALLGSPSGNLTVSQQANQIQIRPSLQEYSSIILFIVVSVGFAVGAWYFWRKDGPQIKNLIIVITMVVFAIAMLVGIVATLMQNGRIVLSQATATLRLGLCEGKWKWLTIPKDQIQVRLTAVNAETLTSPKAKPGNFVLSLAHPDQSDQIIIAIKNNRQLLSDAFDQLQSFLGQAVTATDGDEFELPQGQVLQVSGTPLLKPQTINNCRRRLVKADQQTVILRRFTNDWILWVLMPILDLIIIAIVSIKLPDPKIKAIIIPIIALSMLPGLYFLIRNLRNLYVVADTTQDTIKTCAASIIGYTTGRQICRISQLAAIQICAGLGTKQKGQSTIQIPIYEVNGILQDNQNPRVNFTICPDKDSAAAQAEAFAILAGAPIIDQTGTQTQN
ncbi:MAG: hypothetical protein JW936_10245 [Sedimentisphaerales bacterium]|nr:hypothetical protein [Sedimentisphaerales bacterium]